MNGAGERHLWVWYSPFGLGGVETYLLNMARETARDGARVWVASTKSADGPLREMFVESGVQLLDWSGFHAAFMAQVRPEPIRQRMIVDIERVRPTLFALNDCNDFSIGVAPLLRRLRPYCTVFDTLHIDSPVEQYFEFRRTFLDTVDAVAATNQNVLDRFRARHARSTNVEARYIANGVAVRALSRRPPDSVLQLLYVGRLTRDQKRVMALPRLLAQLRASGRRFSMTVVGDGPCRREFAAELDSRGLSSSVRMTGYLAPADVDQLYFEHDVLVNVSEYEGFSMSVLEALAAGCVPVCTEVASLDRAVFRDDINCRLCPVDRLDDMVDIWRTLKPESLTRLSSAAWTTGQQFTARRMYQAYRDLLTDVRARRPLRPWTREAASALQTDWDVTRHNPWRARPHPLRRLANAARPHLQEALRRVRSR
jgi:glycosyltransferase involved in cell wall biosynthesis